MKPIRAIFRQFSSIAVLAILLTGNFWFSVAPATGQTRELIEQFSADESSLRFKYRNQTDHKALKRFVDFYSLWRTRASQIDFDGLTKDQKIDAVLLKNYAVQLESNYRDKLAKDKIAARLVPFLDAVYQMLDHHEATRIMDAKKVAELMEKVSKNVDDFIEPL